MSEIPSEPPSRSFKGKVAIVTGAGCAGDGIGNGRAISILLADDGCNIVCVDRDWSWARKTCDMVAAKPGRGETLALQGDVTSSSDCENVVQMALQTFGRVDVLINNVGIAGAAGTAVDVDMEQWAKDFDVNVSSMMLYTPMMYAGGMSEEARAARKARSLLGTEGNGWDAACAVVFLASNHARWMTGVILPVDAGTTAAVGIGMTKAASVNG
ncbi:2-(S)-hydroxypropyl-CoM dehydrogenase [Colletotrichum orchidophilum]|uniref:2-(S)-hydroxypropyl-CoM dehydrogenase n=1 Tax=Colletotrichum orchidophilum TaxID=1209926 RepID=A0A1G4BB76_9PEZI|nr:2-(S)-hydroxypropyl-CoM dehydrogenase [Colletotrichum orchidophilum]OHE98661.1 2-(S)-hydroxypropyl-CoM dehydrogenase [Colletotrichum orchidophilum]